MLFDDEEVQIMSAALQPHLREPHRSELISRRIFEDFLAARDLAGCRVLELGPGQYDLARMVEGAGATMVSMDHDPAVIALGRKRGYNVIQADFRTFDWSSLRGQFDGLLSRGSITPLWARDNGGIGSFVNVICSALKPSGWGWIAPWNNALADFAPDRAQTLLKDERQAFGRNGFRAIDPVPQAIMRYGLGRLPILFLKGLDIDGSLGSTLLPD